MAITNNGINNSADNDLYINSLSNDGACETFDMRKSRAGAVITSGDALGAVFFSGFDGTNFIPGAKILSTSSGTIGTGRVASNLVFQTHPDSNSAILTRMTIASTGAITIPAPDSGNTLTLSALGNGVVLSSSTGVISSLNTGAANTVLVSSGVGSVPTWAAVPATSGVTAIAGTANQWSVSGSTGSVTGSLPSTVITPGSLSTTTTLAAGNLTTAGIVQNSVTTGILTSYAATQYNVQIGNASGQLASVSPGATGIPLVSQGASANPAFSTATVPGGGTGLTTTTAYAVITGGTTSTGNLQQVSGLGSSGQALVSNGAGALPSWQTVSGGVTSLTGTANQVSVSASTGAVTVSTPSVFIGPGSVASTTTNAAGTNFLLPTTSASAGQLQINSQRFVHSFGTDNTFVGALAGNLTTTSSQCTAIGANAGKALVSGANATYVGANAGLVDAGGDPNDGNTGIGSNALVAYTGSTGARNTCVGYNSLGSLVTGQHNVAIGWSAGSSLTTNDGNNIYIGYLQTGSAGENNFCRIGNGTGTGAGQLNEVHFSGIYNTAVGATAGVVLAASDNQLGGLAGAASTVLVGGTKPSFTGSPSVSGSVTAASGGFISTNGDVVVGNTAAATTAPFVTFKKSRSAGVITSGDVLGEIDFTGIGATTVYVTGASIRSVSSGTIASTRVAANLIFATHPDSTTGVTDRVTIASTGAVTIAAPDGTAVNLNLVRNSGNIALSLNGDRFITTSDNINCFVGNECGTTNASGTYNTCIGYQPGSSLSSGNNNTMVGSTAGALLTTGSYNVFVGGGTAGNNGAGSACTSSQSSNIYINNVGASESNTLRIGAGTTTGTGSGQLAAAYIHGISGVTVTGTAVLCATNGQLGTIASSKRFKENINDMGTDSSGVLLLRPVTFNYIDGKGPTEDTKEAKSKFYGLIAEEVAEVLPDLVVYDENKEPLAVKYHDLPALLLNEVQRMSAEIQKLTKRIEQLEARL